MKIELLIQNGDKVYEPVTEEGIIWTTERAGAPGKIDFSVLIDNTLNITEGNAVRLRINDKDLFYGFIFSKQSDRSGKMRITAYDQLRYFKNKDTYVFENRTAGEILQVLASDFRLNTGTIENTGYKIATQTEENSTLFDMVQAALDTTLENTTNHYFIYDEFGKLCLKNVLSMQIPILVDADTTENFDYSSSIDGQTYNKVKLIYENEVDGARNVYVSQDDNNMNNWGTLQYFERLGEDENGNSKADTLLKQYNKRSKTLSVSKTFGDTRVRAGCLVVVRLDVGDANVDDWMLVESCKHEFRNNQHFMDLTLRGGEFGV